MPATEFLSSVVFGAVTGAGVVGLFVVLGGGLIDYMRGRK